MPRYELINLRGEVADIVAIDAESDEDALRLVKSGSHADSDYEILTVDGLYAPGVFFADLSADGDLVGGSDEDDDDSFAAERDSAERSTFGE